MALEDRKRKFEEENVTQSPSSKRPLQSLSLEGPLTQQDVVYYKKEAIWRQMKFYKLQAQEVKNELTRYERRYKAFLASHLLLESWYTTVMQLFGEQSPKKLDIENMTLKEVEELLDQRLLSLVDILKHNNNVNTEDSVSKLLDLIQLQAEKLGTHNTQNVLQEKLAELEDKISELQKAKDRFESASIKRVQISNLQKTEEPEPSPNSASNGENTNGNPAGSVATAEQANTDKQELEELKVEFELMKAGLTSLTESLQTANSKLASAEQANLVLSQKLQNLDEAELLKSAQYVNLLSQNKALHESNNQLLKLKDELVSRISDLEEKEGQVSKTISAEIIDENRHLKELLLKAENDLVRVRTVRDELIGKQAVLKLEVELSKPSSEIVALSEVLNQRLLNLEHRLSVEFTIESDSNLESLDNAELIKRVQLLSGELKDLESAFQETRGLALDKLKDSSEKEGLVKKLTVEKTKADQKYFASMRAKDLLAAENKILKTQISKSQELIQKHGEIEKAYESKIDILHKSLGELKAIKESSIRETSKLYESVKTLTRSREGASKELQQLKEDLSEAMKAKEMLVEEVGDLKYSHGKLQGKLRATENLLQKYKSNNTSSILQEDEKQLEALRAITKCSVCSKHWKNTAITACGHVFCDGCVQERLNARLRRCPTCNKGFSANDLLVVHL